MGRSQPGPAIQCSEYTLLKAPIGLNDAVEISAGSEHSLALRSNGTVVAWGSNYYGQTNVPSGLSNVVAISAGGGNSMALRADGTITAWGDGEGTNVPAGLRVYCGHRGRRRRPCFAQRRNSGALGRLWIGFYSWPAPSLTNNVAIWALPGGDVLLGAVNSAPSVRNERLGWGRKLRFTPSAVRVRP